MEINFYQIDDVLHKSIAPLLLKVLEENKKALIYCQNEQTVKEIDIGLWQFSKTKFVPHATIAEKVDTLKQPVFITNLQKNSNQAEYLVMIDIVDEEFLKQFSRVFYFFGTNDTDKSRKLWAQYKQKSYELNFYRREDGGWVKI